MSLDDRLNRSESSSWDLLPDKASGMPRGKIRVTFATGSDGRTRVQAIAIRIPDAGRIVETESFDDDTLAVDLADGGRFAGLELVSPPDPHRAKEYIKRMLTVGDDRERQLWYVAYVTAASTWVRQQLRFDDEHNKYAVSWQSGDAASDPIGAFFRRDDLLQTNRG